jgi:hypothetical protein
MRRKKADRHLLDDSRQRSPRDCRCSDCWPSNKGSRQCLRPVSFLGGWKQHFTARGQAVCEMRERRSRDIELRLFGGKGSRKVKEGGREGGREGGLSLLLVVPSCFPTSKISSKLTSSPVISCQSLAGLGE